MASATGDIRNNLKKLQNGLRRVRYPHDPDLEMMLTGNAEAFLPIYHYVFLEYSQGVSQKLTDSGIDLFGKTDMRFVESMYKALRDIFDYKPPLNKGQFLSRGFSERKVIMCVDIINLLRDMHTALQSKPKVRRSQTHNSMVTQRNLSTVSSGSTLEQGQVLMRPNAVVRRSQTHNSMVTQRNLSTVSSGSTLEQGQVLMRSNAVVVNEVRQPRHQVPAVAQSWHHVPEVLQSQHHVAEVVQSHRQVPDLGHFDVTRPPVHINTQDSGDSGCGTRSASPETLFASCSNFATLKQQLDSLSARLTILENKFAMSQAEAAAPPLALMRVLPEREIPERDIPNEAVPSPVAVNDNAEESFVVPMPVPAVGGSPDGSFLMTTSSTPSRSSNPNVSTYINNAVREQARRISSLMTETEALMNNEQVD